jgi:hypothetical protein
MSSATGGVLTTPLPDETALRRFLQGLVAGITQLPGASVRPRWQRKPPPMPAADADWVSFDIRDRTVEGHGYLVPTSDDESKLVRWEAFSLACSFYGPNGAAYAERLRDGLELSQNREPLLLAGMSYRGPDTLQHLPELHNDEWHERHDLTLRFARELDKRYDVLCFVGALGAIITETLTLPFENPTVEP